MSPQSDQAPLRGVRILDMATVLAAPFSATLCGDMGAEVVKLELPSGGDPLRGPYLRWIVYYGSSFEPALIDKAQKREPAPPSMSPYGDYDTMLKTLTDNLALGPHMLGERFSAADVLWGTALGWTTKFGLVAHTPVIDAYVARVEEHLSAAAGLLEELRTRLDDLEADGRI